MNGSNSGNEQTTQNFDQWRMLVIFGIIALIFGFYFFKLFNLQIIRGTELQAAADANRQAITHVQTQRGIIYDRNGFVLARNVAAYNVVITPAYLPSDDGATQEVYRQLSALIGVPVSKGELTEDVVKVFKPCENDLGITQIVYIGGSLYPYNPVRVKCSVDEKTAMVVREKSSDWPGVSVEVQPVRDYPTGELTAEIIGFLGPIPADQEKEYTDKGFLPGRDKVGFAGVELSMNDLLMGQNGERTVEVDVAGQEIRDLKPPVPAVPGSNLKLTIDTRLQTATRNALTSVMKSYNYNVGYDKYTSGVVVAENPKTGEILAMVSYPSYQNNRMARVIPSYYYQQLSVDPARPMLNHAISAEHPPGSVFKMAAAIGALNEDVITPEKQIEDPGKITVMQKFTPNDPGQPFDFVCYLYKTTGGGHGMVSFLRGVEQSCDVYFYKIGGGYGEDVPQGLGIWRLGEYARALGYGKATGIELVGEASGLIPDPNWKRVNQGENWATGDTYIATIGQGYVLSTPMQVLTSVATLANDGKYMKPTLIHEVLDSEGNVTKPFEPKMWWDITKDPVITVYDENNFPTDQKITVQPWVVEKAKEGMRLVVSQGTALTAFEGMQIQSAGKTGTAEYCDNVAQLKNLCIRGNWPAHAWYMGYAPYDNPEIAVVAFVYSGDEGARLAAPIVRKVMDAYFELKAIDQSGGMESTTP